MTKRDIVAAARAKLEKSYGPGILFSMNDTDIVPIKTVSTGAATLDAALGIGGFPYGRITELYGPESAGKTTVALTAVAVAQKRGELCAIVDVEHALDFEYAKRLGVDTSTLLISQPDSGEQALDVVETLVRSGCSLVVLDSVAMLIPQAEIQGEMDSFQVGAQARLVSKALRKLTAPIAENDVCVIFINQIRMKIGGYGNPETTPGGNALKYASSVRIELRRGDTVRDGEQNVGVEIKAKVVKNKLAPPYTAAKFHIFFAKGISLEASLAEIAIEQGIVIKGGAWLTYGSQKFQGNARFVEWLEGNPDEVVELQARMTKGKIKV